MELMFLTELEEEILEIFVDYLLQKLPFCMFRIQRSRCKGIIVPMECHVEIQSGEMSPLIRISVEQPVIAQGTFESL